MRERKCQRRCGWSRWLTEGEGEGGRISCCGDGGLRELRLREGGEGEEEEEGVVM